MAYLPQRIRGIGILSGLKLITQGKVRDIYEIPGYDGLYLIVTSNRASIYDFLLGKSVPMKGAVLNLIAVFWKLLLMRQYNIVTDLVAWGERIDNYLPQHLRNDKMLHMCAVIVRKEEMVKYELVVRNKLAGGGLKTYKDPLKKRTLSGHELPAGLWNGAPIPGAPIFAPSNKAERGHDEDVDWRIVEKDYPGIGEFSLKIFTIISKILEEECDIIFADTKFEGFLKDGAYGIGDELANPDSSRLWDKKAYEEAQARDPKEAPTGFDKQFLRLWGELLGINDKKQFDPMKDEDCERVAALEVPQEVIEKTTELYLTFAYRLSKIMRELNDPTLTKMVNALLG